MTMSLEYHISEFRSVVDILIASTLLASVLKLLIPLQCYNR